MAKIDAGTAEPGFQPEPFVLMKRAVVSLLADVERKGEVD